MMSGTRDPFEDLLNLEDEEGDAPPVPISQPPQPDRWMVLPDNGDDFKSVSEDDLFGAGARVTSSKAHGTTFDDLFGEGSQDKKTKKSSGHGSTFDDLFGEETSNQHFENEKTTYEDLFPDEFDPNSSIASAVKSDSSSLRSTKIKSSKNSDNIGMFDDDLFASPDSETNRKSEKSFGFSKNDENSIDDLFGSKSKKSTASSSPCKSKEGSVEEMFGSVCAPASSDVSVKMSDENLDLFGCTSSKRKEEPDLLKDTEMSYKRQPPGPTYSNLVGNEPIGCEDSDDVEDLFGSLKEKSSKKAEKNLDDIFGDSSSKPAVNDLFGEDTGSNSKSTTEIYAEINGTSSNTSSGVDDLFSKIPSSKEATRDNTAKVSDSEMEDGKVDILLPPAEKPKRTSRSDMGDSGELDFSLIEDTSLLDPNITRHKSSLSKRGSLARRKRPTRSSMRRVFQEEDSTHTQSAADENQHKLVGGDKVTSMDTVQSPTNKPKKTPDKMPPVQVKSPLFGGKMLIGPDVLAQSKLVKGIASKNEQLLTKSLLTSDANSGMSSQPEPDKSPETHKPVIKLSKPQLSPRPRVLKTPDLKTSPSALTKQRNMEPKPDIVMSTLNNDNNQKETTSAFSSVLKPVREPEPGSSKVTPVTLEKVTLRSSKSMSSPPDPKVASPSPENNVIHSELTERKNSLRRVSPALNKESDEPKEERKSNPTWLNEMKLRSTLRKTQGVTTTKSDTPSKSDGDKVKASLKPSLVPRNRDVENPRMSENKPLTPRKPTTDRPKPKIESNKSATGLSDRGDGAGRSPLGVKETNTTSIDVPSWKRELAERKKKRKDDPMSTSTPPKTETQQDVAANWRTQLSQKKRKPVTMATGEVKAIPDSKQPEWALQAEQRRARLAKSGLLGQK